MGEKFSGFWQLVVDHLRDGQDIKTTRRDVRREQHRHTPSAEVGDDPIASILAHIALKRSDRISLRREQARELFDTVLGSAKDKRGAWSITTAIQQSLEGVKALTLRNRIDMLDDRRRGSDLALGHFRFHTYWIVQVAPGDADCPRREGRGEERELPFGRNHCEDAFDIGREPCVEHLIGLIEYDVVEMLHIQRAVSEMIQHSAWRADDDLGPSKQRLALRSQRAAANELRHP
jgi:hypothetical protein